MPVHFGFNVFAYYLIASFTSLEFTLANCLIILSAELIDLDHLWARPIYDKSRNSLKTHFLHKNWKWIVGIGIALIPFYPLTFFGLGLISHIGLDYLFHRLGKLM